jgi:DNA modification methylase
MSYRILQGDVLTRLGELPDESVQCVVTSPPYWGLRDYGCAGQMGLEKTPAEYIAKMTEVFAEVRRVLRPEGTCWVNMGDSYAGGGRGGGAEGCKQRTSIGSLAAVPNQTPEGLKPKDLAGMPWRLAFALQEDGWWLRQDIIWSKPNPMPESVTDRCTKAHEYIFLLTKSAKYFYDQDAIRMPFAEETLPRSLRGQSSDVSHSRLRRRRFACGERVDNAKGANKRSVWEIATEGYAGAHFATFPTKLVEPCIRAGCPPGGTVLDPFSGSGTTGLVAIAERCNFIGIELNPEYVAMSERRLAAATAQGVLI